MVDAAKEAIFLSLAAALRLTIMVIMASCVDGNVQKPPKELLPNQVQCSKDWSFLGQFSELVSKFPHASRINLTTLRNVHHIALDIACGLVMLAMGDLPREIRHEEC